MNKTTRALQLLNPTSKRVGLDIKTLRRCCSKREQLDSSQTDVWSFIGRFPCSDMKLIDAVKGLVQNFWRGNSRPFIQPKSCTKIEKGFKGL